MTPPKFGRYELKHELGRGGMATVFRAYDPRFERDVAIKVLPPEFLHDPNFRLRFEREARTIATLEHSAIIPVYDFGEEANQPYLVMRYLSGGTMSDRLKKGPLPLAEVQRIINIISPGLDEAHRRGIIHRDLKPDNILFDQYNEPYIADFGIAKLSAGSAGLTSSNVVIGTPAYMSPEQARGETELDGRSDIYTLGVILFEMLTAKLPYNAATPVGLLMQHITEPPPDILKITPGLPPHYRTVIYRAMAKQPNDRYPTAVSLAQALIWSQADAPPPSVSRPLSPAALARRKVACPNCGSMLSGEVALNQPRLCSTCGLELILVGSAGGVEIRQLCPNCHTANRNDLQFCASCEQRLKVACVRCHAHNPANAVSCYKCGANLKSAESRRQELLEARTRSQKEREQAFKEKEVRQRQEKINHLVQSLANPVNQEFVIFQLDEIGEEAITPLLAALSGAAEPSARIGAAKSLGQIYQHHELKPLDKSKLVKGLIKALSDPSPAVRLRAAEAVSLFSGQLGQAAVDPLGALLKDKHEEVRQQARLSLQKIGGERANEILRKAGGLMGWLKR
jgi:serine/threonine-protein kinase